MTLRAEQILQQLTAAGADSPALVLDEAVMMDNIAAMARTAERHGVALRPHAKTHKSSEIGKRQMDHGAIGLCVTKVGEAETLYALGCPLHLSAPVVGGVKLERLATLAKTMAEDLTVVVDHLDGVADLASAAARHAVTFHVMIDVDVGQLRTGARTAEDASALAQALADAPRLSVAGVQAYGGHVQHIERLDDRRAAASASDVALRQAIAACAPHIGTPRAVTGSGTGAHALDIALGTYTDLQVGSYIFSDVEYDAIEHDAAGGERSFKNALYILARVVSCNQPGIVTIDAGSKSISMDGPMPRPVAGCPDGTRWEPFGDEFGQLVLPAGAEPLARDALILAVVPHCDPTINLFDDYTVVRPDGTLTLWPVEARGRSQ